MVCIVGVQIPYCTTDPNGPKGKRWIDIAQCECNNGNRNTNLWGINYCFCF